ncbi:MAG: M16 family metallopeptidase, partial [Gemmatimonas sp.]
MLRSLCAASLFLAAGALEAQQATRKAPPRRPATTRAVPAPAEPPMSPAIMGDDSLTIKFEVSGIPVIMRRVTANNVVAANLYLLGGARQLTPETQGIELMLLEASERGTQKYPRDVLRTKMAALGSAIGVSAGADWTSVGLRATTAGLDSTWAILADRLMAPRLETADVEFVREQFATAVAQRKDSPDALLEFLSDSIAFAGHPYALEPTGTEQSYKRITAQQLQQYQT